MKVVEAVHVVLFNAMASHAISIRALVGSGVLGWSIVVQVQGSPASSLVHDGLDSMDVGSINGLLTGLACGRVYVFDAPACRSFAGCALSAAAGAGPTVRLADCRIRICTRSEETSC